MSHKQRTLKSSVTFEGLGIHTGQSCRMVLHPAEADHGRVFVTAEGVDVRAHVDQVHSCQRSTVLGKDEARVHTPEHLLSALFAHQIDNVRIEMSGPEVPIMDGSAREFSQALGQVGAVEQEAPAPCIVPKEPFSVRGENGELVLVLPAESLSFHYALHYDHPMIGYQEVDFFPSKESYDESIAPARTFALYEEVQVLLERGLAKGGSLDNALVIHQDRFSSDLTCPHEPARHKCLDLIGDFALLDARIQAKILAVKAGHRWHVDCAKLVWAGRN